jgi:hypothetical protein
VDTVTAGRPSTPRSFFQVHEAVFWCRKAQLQPTFTTSSSTWLLLLFLGATQDADFSLLPGLCIALEHPTLSSSPQMLCAAAPVCKDWRQAVQQCAARNTVMQLDLRSSTNSAVPVRLASFSRWLLQHGALVKCMTIQEGWVGPCSGLTSAECLAAAMQMVQTPMQTVAAWSTAAAESLETAAATGGAAATGAAAAAATLAAAAGKLLINGGLQPVSELHNSWQRQQQQQQQQMLLSLLQQQWLPPLLSQPQRQPGLHLASFRFSGDEPGVADIVAVLPAHSLTRLSMSLVSSKSVDAAALSAALARLSSLQQLQATSLPFACWPALGQLSRLTQLELIAESYPKQSAGNAEAALQQLLMLPLSLQQLRLHLSGYGLSVSLPADMRHLARLEDLDITARLAEGTVLPAAAALEVARIQG